MHERRVEKAWKLSGRPIMDRWVPADANWVYCPMETRFPCSNTPVAITFHDARIFEPELSFSTGFRRSFYRARTQFWMRRAAADASLIFTVSNHARGRLIELMNLPETKVVSVGNGISHAAMSKDELIPALTRRLASVSPYVVVIGGLRRLKGGDYVLAVARELKRDGNKMRILIIGTPHDRDLVQEARILGNVEILGMVDDQTLTAHLSGATALLLLSRYEGFGITALEAMIYGVPVIASNCSSLPEVVGDAGILLSPEKTHDIMSALYEVGKDSPLTRKIIDSGFHRVQCYTWDHVADRVLAAMHNISSGSRNL